MPLLVAEEFGLPIRDAVSTTWRSCQSDTRSENQRRPAEFFAAH